MGQITTIKNRLRRELSFQQGALILAVIISLGASLLVGLPLTRASISQLESQSEQLRSALSRQASNQAADAIFTQDLLSLNVILSNLVAHPDIAYGAVYNLRNDIIAEQGSSQSLEGKPLSIQYQNEVIGLLDVRLNDGELENTRYRLFALWALLSVLFTLFNLALAWVGGRWMSRRILKASKDIQQLSQSQLPASVRQYSFMELNALTQAIAEYQGHKHSQQAMEQALNQFMTPKPEPTERPAMTIEDQQSYDHAAILFLDFVDFASVQQTMSPSELAALLNQYYFFIDQAAKLYNGTVDKFVGDGVMVLFGIPHADEKDAFHGVCTGLLIIGLIKKFNDERQQQGLPVIEFQLGLHTGMVLTLADRETSTHTAVGDAVYTAQRLCHTSEANRLLVSKDVLSQKALGSQLIASPAGLGLTTPEREIQGYWANELSGQCQALIQRQVTHIRAQLEVTSD